MNCENALLQVEQVQVCFGHIPLLRHVSMHIYPGEVVGLVGESGSGKSLTALSIMGLLESPLMKVTTGQIRFNNTDMINASESELEKIRGNEVAMIFQEPMTSLNPVFTIGNQVVEALQLHTSLSRNAAIARAKELIARVGVVPSDKAMHRYPHQLSGGQRQRIMIAMAIACHPKLLIADEPTTALDVTVQAQILELLDELRRETGMSILLIAHDLGVVRQYCDKVAVMYCGQIVEQSDTSALFSQPQHPYTRALLQTIPAANPRGFELPSISGTVPPPDALPVGCAFSDRCVRPGEKCRSLEPGLAGDQHLVRCWYPLQYNALEPGFNDG